jgi:signal transduction histidine kinase
MQSKGDFTRQILKAFATASALAIVAVAIGIWCLSWVGRAKDTAVANNLGDVKSAELLTHYHETRLGEIRAYLLSRDRAHLQKVRDIETPFHSILDSLDRDSEPPFLRNTLAQIRVLDSQYKVAVDRAIRSPTRVNWILDHEVRPAREKLERHLAELGQLTRASFDSAYAASKKKALTAFRIMLGLGLATLVGLLFLGLAVYQKLRQEQDDREKSKETQDILQTARQRAALLAETGRILSESSDPKAALGSVASQSVEWLCDLFLIELAEDHGLVPVALVTAQKARAPLLNSLHENLPQGLGSLFDTEGMFQSPTPSLQEQVTDERLEALGVKSYIGVPLRARGRSLGVLLLVRTGDSASYISQDLQFARELSHQIALAIDNARLLQEAEVGLRMREELLATVAHDLKNPLSMIRITSDLAVKELKGNEELRRLFHSIREAVLEMQRLIHDLLELTQIESGRIVLDRSPHDATDLVEACVKGSLPQASARSIEIVPDIRPGECIADCDRNRILQVLSNLVGNAIKFTAPGGRVRIDAQATGEGIRFSVIDNGPGIPAEQLPYVFERYWQARRAQQRGTGLGLSIARGLVEAHGGRIWAESALNIGSRFFFVLPEARIKLSKPEKAA